MEGNAYVLEMSRERMYNDNNTSGWNKLTMFTLRVILKNSEVQPSGSKRTLVFPENTKVMYFTRKPQVYALQYILKHHGKVGALVKTHLLS